MIHKHMMMKKKINSSKQLKDKQLNRKANIKGHFQNIWKLGQDNVHTFQGISRTLLLALWEYF